MGQAPLKAIEFITKSICLLAETHNKQINKKYIRESQVVISIVEKCEAESTRVKSGYRCDGQGRPLRMWHLSRELNEMKGQ